MKLHVKVEISGKVQGVWFRKSAKAEADDLGVVGYVQNCVNGTVYMEIEGEEETLEIFLQWCKMGPPDALVKDLVVLQYEDLKHYGSFMIQKEAVKD